MALSQKSQNILIDAMASKPAALALLAAIAGQSALDSKNSVILSDALASPIHAKTKKQSVGDEILAAIVSGAALSYLAKVKIIEMMASASAGNELINVIQSVATPSVKL